MVKQPDAQAWQHLSDLTGQSWVGRPFPDSRTRSSHRFSTLDPLAQRYKPVPPLRGRPNGRAAARSSEKLQLLSLPCPFRDPTQRLSRAPEVAAPRRAGRGRWQARQQQFQLQRLPLTAEHHASTGSATIAAFAGFGESADGVSPLGAADLSASFSLHWAPERRCES